MFRGSSLVIKVNPPTLEEARLLGDRALLSFFFPAQNQDLLNQLQVGRRAS